MSSRLKEVYKNEIVDAMMKKFNYKNIMEVPKLEKVVINMGVGEAKENAKVLETAVKDLETIAGQKAVLTKAKKSVANFKIREGMAIGCKVTLRGERMYEFVDRLINLSLPRVRDFRGVNPNAFDGRGNYALGIKEQLIFPEIEKLKAEVQKMTAKKLFIDIKEVKRPDKDAQLVAENIAMQLENRTSFRRAMKSTMSRSMKAGALGIKTSVSGRLSGADMARTEFYSEGTIPLQTLRADIDYGFAEADTTYGKIGVKVWIYKGEVLPKKGKKEGGAQ